MPMFNFAADIAAKVYGEVESENADEARSKIEKELRLRPFLQGAETDDFDIEWELKSKCHGNVCSFCGNTEDEYGLDVMKQDDD